MAENKTLAATLLATCIGECTDARTGHGRRWAKQRAHVALVEQGTAPWLAAALATAAEQVGLTIKARATPPG
jgi:hypothetical protein